MDGNAVKADWGGDDWKVERDAYLREWIGDETAFQFLMTISNITEFFDDLVDADKEIDVKRVTDTMFAALVTLPSNPFYRQHQVFLTPIIIMAMNTWLDSNILAGGNKNERTLAYTLRNMDVQLVQALIYITRGQAYLREVSPQLWRMFAAEQDDADSWIGGGST